MQLLLECWDFPESRHQRSAGSSTALSRSGGANVRALVAESMGGNSALIPRRLQAH